MNDVITPEEQRMGWDASDGRGWGGEQTLTFHTKSPTDNT